MSSNPTGPTATGATHTGAPIGAHATGATLGGSATGAPISGTHGTHASGVTGAPVGGSAGAGVAGVSAAGAAPGVGGGIPASAGAGGATGAADARATGASVAADARTDADRVGEQIHGGWNVVHGAGEELRGKVNSFFDGLGEGVTGKADAGAVNDSATTAKGQAEYEAGKAQLNKKK